MKQITTLIIALIIVSSLSAQVIQFQKTYGGSGTDRCWSIRQTTDGGYILAGETNSTGAGSFDAYLIKTDAFGTTQWARTYGGTGYDWAKSVRQTTDGGYIVAGGTESSGNGLGDIWVFKTNSSGVLSWQRTIGTVNGDAGNDVILTSDGGYAAAGFQNGSAGDDNACLVKMDGSGNIQWVHTYSVGANYDYAYSVAQASDGGYFIGGESDDSSGVGIAALLVKTDANGSAQWANFYGTPNDHWISKVIALPGGGCVIGGVAMPTTSYDAWLAKLNPNGTPVWSNSYGAAGAGADICLWFTTTSDGGYALSGRTNSFSTDYEAFLIKTDTSGGPEWSRRYGGTANEVANQVVQSSNGGYAIGASSLSFGSGESAYFIRTDTNGVSGCNEGIPAFLMSPAAASATAVTVTDLSLTNVAASALSSAAATFTENPLCLTVGGNELSSAEDLISVYPNPAKDGFVIVTGFTGGFTIEGVEIYSSVGKKIFSQEYTADSQKKKVNVDTHSWSVGVYFVRIKTSEGFVVKKLVKQ